MSVEAKVRYKDDPSPATVHSAEGAGFRLVFEKAKRAITPGQSVVLYDGDDVICGGVIEEVLSL
jgi:tRNA-specific 2-thiouridylase